MNLSKIINIKLIQIIIISLYLVSNIYSPEENYGFDPNNVEKISSDATGTLTIPGNRGIKTYQGEYPVLKNVKYDGIIYTVEGASVSEVHEILAIVSSREEAKYVGTIIYETENTKSNSQCC